jgi:glycosyltransferase involved in cell wall biosynthesis
MRLSIVIPTLNEEDYLPNLLSEIKKQDFPWEYEIIVADAGSKDKTVKIAENFGCKIVKGGLPAKGRNKGAESAKGDLILFIDADNVYLPENFIKNAVFEFEKRNLGVACFPIFVKGNIFDRIIYLLYNLWAELTQKFLPYAFNTILVKKEIHQKIGGFNEEIKIAEDIDYARRAAKVSSFGIIKTQPILTSPRRLDTDGRLIICLKYLLVGFLTLFHPIKSEIFNYKFGHYKRNKK